MAMLGRVKLRKPEKSDGLIQEYLQTAKDKINLRLGTEDLPAIFETIAVEVTIALINQHEVEGLGVAEESADNWRIKILDDVLKPYQKDFDDYIAKNTSKREVKFI